MIVRFFTRFGAVIDWKVPTRLLVTPFDFPEMCEQIRGTGFFQSPDLHLQYPDIACIALLGDGDGASDIKFTGNAPSSGVKQ